jgi:NAD(P)-dependent dehydrogenase (short-subunit alcohol dehydrogenase family)
MENIDGKSLIVSAIGMAAVLGARAIARRIRRYDLKGKRALITGGSRGLGLIIARELVAEGVRVAICARDEEELGRARHDLIERGGDVLAIRCDITDPAQAAETVEIATGHFGGIDILVNNAGVIQVGPMEEMTMEDYDEAMKVHFMAPLVTSLAVIPGMRARGEGRIVNIASIGGKVSVPHLLPYCASKFALVGLSEGMHAELAKEGIIVTTICPGLMRTGSHLHAEVRGRHEEEFSWFSILGSLPGTSMNADRAGRRVVEAIRDGEAEVVLSAPAKLLSRLHGLYPDETVRLLGLINEILPAPGGSGGKKSGSRSRSEIAPSILTSLSDSAAVENNELAASH